MKNFKTVLLLFISTGLLIFTACRNEGVPAIEIVAKAGDEYLTREQLLNWMPPNLTEEQRTILSRQYINRWVQKTVMASSARKDGISLTPYENWSLDFLQKEMLSQKYLSAKLPRDIIITDESISTYYDENKEQYIRNEDEIHLVQLFLENLDAAIGQEIREQKSLLEVIKKNFLDSPGNRMVERNGDLGYVPVSSLRKEITRTVKSGSTGRVYGPITMENGYYYFQMMDKQAGGTFRSLDLVKEDIRLRLAAIKRENLAEDLAKKLLEKYSVSTYPEHL